MTTICFLVDDPAREIVEGRTKLRPVRTVPVMPFVVAAASAPAEPFSYVSLMRVDRKMPNGRPNLNGLVQKFKRLEPGDFTAIQLQQFLRANDLPSARHAATAQLKLRKLEQAGAVVCAKRGRGQTATVWRFA